VTLSIDRVHQPYGETVRVERGYPMVLVVVVLMQALLSGGVGVPGGEYFLAPRDSSTQEQASMDGTRGTGQCCGKRILGGRTRTRASENLGGILVLCARGAVWRRGFFFQRRPLLFSGPNPLANGASCASVLVPEACTPALQPSTVTWMKAAAAWTWRVGGHTCTG
jgi:hypothetical protein